MSINKFHHGHAMAITNKGKAHNYALQLDKQLLKREKLEYRTMVWSAQNNI
ncbi:hypothetical protein N9157_03900 [Saprospiraceae bacterium]|nr:hypothetical protein [Saprospiraceae bacterium]MDB4539486.1 hypothetical protein [Saprospiraceae bacterium]